MTLANNNDSIPLHVIYARRSAGGQQSGQTCDEQVERCTEHLKRLGMDPGPFIVITDDGNDGTKPGCDRVVGLMRAERLATLVVVGIDRLCRGDNAVNFVRDVVVNGGHFIAVDNAVSTDREGWEDLVRLATLFGSPSAATPAVGHGDRVLRFGYTAVMRKHRRARPARRVIVIDEAAACVVRQIFDLALTGQTPAAIAAVMIANGVRRISTAGRVRSVLTDRAYTGRWTWGRVRTTRDLRAGRRRRADAPAGRRLCVERPELRIVTDDVFDRVQAHLNAKADAA